MVTYCLESNSELNKLNYCDLFLLLYLSGQQSAIVKMNDPSQQQSTPADVRNIVTEILQSDEFCNQLRYSIQRASYNSSVPASGPTQRIPVATPAEELRRLFPSIRGSNNSNVILNSNTTTTGGRNQTSVRSKKRRRSQKMLVSDFKRDIILVGKPEVTKTLIGLEKSSAYANGYAVSAATFQRTWTEREIFQYIESLFLEKLHGIKFEILIPIAGNLVRPNIPEGTILDGTIMCHLFSQKTVYIRPFSDIVRDTELSEIDDNSNDLFENISENKNNEDHNLLAVNQLLTENNIESEKNIEENSNQYCDSKLESNISEDEINTEANLIDQIFDNDTTVAIKHSLEVVNEKTMLDILRELHERIDMETTSQFNIYREDIFNCCLRALRRKNFSPLNKISVLFTDIDNISEGAIDMGGPTKEMFRLLLKYLASSTLFEGSEHSKNITLCSEHLESKHYYDAGRIIALSLIHGGPSPQFFSETLFNYLVSGVDATKPCFNEIMNAEIRNELERIRDAPDLCELQLAVQNSTFMAIAGFTNIPSFDRKATILESAAKYYLIYRATPALEQFKEGLNILGLLEKLKVFEEFKDLMCYTDSKLTVEKISSIFKVKYSEVGSNNRNTESRILTFWNDFLLDCQERETQATLEDVLCFATACEKIPPLGFDGQPQLEFLHNEDFLWPKANTCSPILYLPVSYKGNEYDKFRNNMDYAIMNGMQFGFA